MSSLLTRIVREKLNGGCSWPDAPSPPNSHFHLQSNFCTLAESLRDQFEKRILAAIDLNDGLTPLLYAYCQDGYQFLTASAERIFSTELLEVFLDSTRIWAVENLGASCVSTPQLRVYFKGCYRALISDNVEARWHWLLALGRGSRSSGRIRLSTNGVRTEVMKEPVTIDRILRFPLEFNQLLVHSASCAYAVEQPKGSLSPLEGTVLLDGYFW